MLGFVAVEPELRQSDAQGVSVFVAQTDDWSTELSVGQTLPITPWHVFVYLFCVVCVV